MDLTLHTNPSVNLIRSVSAAKGIKVQEKWYEDGLIITPTTLRPGWAPSAFDEISDADLELLLSLTPEVLLIGGGLASPTPDIRPFARFLTRGTGVEIMSTEAAARTYNVLVTENRQAVAALMPLK